MIRSISFLLFALFLAAPLSVSQVQSNALLRVFFIKVGNFTGSAFTVERNQRQYLITTKHLVDTLPKKGATIQIFSTTDGWKELKVNILSCRSPDVDIAVLELEKQISVTFELEPSSDGIFFGQDGFMLGFPFGLHPMSVDSRPVPFIKRVTLSSKDGSNTDAVIWYFDGFNNPGFSGGPIVFWDRHASNKMKVAAVISGFRNETAKAVINGQQVDTNILVNSGIVIAYDIRHALDAIDAAASK